ncbi:MAG TPA: hypothetical protein VFJ14_10745 [Nocardioidaceae bacterium]|nr:hypothetical protein [Nocardioidaceae bacterium]
MERDAARAVDTFTDGVRSSLRDNATAYGYSVSITAAFALVSNTHGKAGFALHVLMFAAGAAVAFFVVELVASRMFARVAGGELERVVLIGGAVDVLSILAAVGSAVGLARIPGVAAWSLTAAGVTTVFLLVGGLDVLIARRLDRDSSK